MLQGLRTPVSQPGFHRASYEKTRGISILRRVWFVRVLSRVDANQRAAGRRQNGVTDPQFSDG
jgi:hypothetical protein